MSYWGHNGMVPLLLLLPPSLLLIGQLWRDYTPISSTEHCEVKPSDIQEGKEGKVDRG